MEDIKNVIRVAHRIRYMLTRLRHCRYLELARRLHRFAGEMQEIATVSRKMMLALGNEWLAATERCCLNVDRLLDNMPYSISRIRQFTDAQGKEVPNLSTLIQELGQVEQEFGSIEIDAEKGTVSATTEPITLDDIYLGPFSIQLEVAQIDELYHASPYRVVALEPNPATSDEGVTHPHITSEKLCEGDGCAAVVAALEEGRFSDFFCLVRSILNTYNPDSPYVSLSDWFGEPCYDCGYTVSGDSSYFCSFCEHTFCEECVTSCRSCDETICVGCAVKCQCCEDPVCPKCARIRCSECENVCCESCIEEGLCPDCLNERNTEDDQQPETTETKDNSRPQADNEGMQANETCPEIQPDCMGQAAVLQG